jgi:hypothetical protein
MVRSLFHFLAVLWEAAKIATSSLASEVCADRSSGAQELFAEDLGFHTSWQVPEQSDNPKRKFLSTISQLLLPAKVLFHNSPNKRHPRF